MIQYSTYQAGDERRIVELWNECLVIDPITSLRFRHLILLDANFDPAGLQLAFDEDKLVGCLYGIRRLMPMTGVDLETDNGWITFFFVDQKYRRLGVGQQLMEHAITFFKQQDIKNVFFSSYAPNYIVPGIDQAAYETGYSFLKAQQFTELYAAVAMDRSLVNFALSDHIKQLKMAREAENYSFRQAVDEDLYELIQFATQQFNPDWGRAIREGLLRQLPIDRILVARRDNIIVGFCLYGAYEGVPERFGPFGVDLAEQGKGLGKILLHLCLQQMRAESLHSAWFLWTGEQTSAGHLYRKSGFNITRTFHIMKRIISK